MVSAIMKTAEHVLLLQLLLVVVNVSVVGATEPSSQIASSSFPLSTATSTTTDKDYHGLLQNLPLGLTGADLVNTYVDTIKDLQYCKDQFRQQRSLAIGDFDNFNRLIENATIALPDANVGSNGLEITIKNFYCTGLQIGDVQASYETLTAADNSTGGGDVVALTITAAPFALNCFGDYTYNIFLVSGSGQLEAFSTGNMVSTRIDLTSPQGFLVAPPTLADVNFCNANIDTAGNVGFKGGMVADILNSFKGPVSDVIDSQASTSTCEMGIAKRTEFVCVFVR
jgi:hypothetical protein